MGGGHEVQLPLGFVVSHHFLLISSIQYPVSLPSAPVKVRMVGLAIRKSKQLTPWWFPKCATGHILYPESWGTVPKNPPRLPQVPASGGYSQGATGFGEQKRQDCGMCWTCRLSSVSGCKSMSFCSAALGFALRAPCLQGRCSSIWATSPAFLALVTFQIGSQVLLVLDGPSILQLRLDWLPVELGLQAHATWPSPGVDHQTYWLLLWLIIQTLLTLTTRQSFQNSDRPPCQKEENYKRILLITQIEKQYLITFRSSNLESAERPAGCSSFS
jgi:hypothetical protein